MATDDLAQFAALVQSLLSSENECRSQAEAAYEGLDIKQKLTFLLQTMRNAENAMTIRSMCAVLLRRLFTSSFSDFWPNLSPDEQSTIKNELLLAIQQESAPSVRKKLCDASSELARNHLDDDGNNSWPEFLKFLFTCACSTEEAFKESALHILMTLPGIFGNQQSHYLDVIKEMLSQCLHDQMSLQVRFEAVKATTAFLVANEGEANVMSSFRETVTALVQTVAESIEVQDADDTVLKCLIELAETLPKYLRPQIENIMTLCLKTIADASLMDNWRQMALEVIVTLSESAPAMVRKHSKFIPLLVPQVLALMIDVEDDEDWSTADDIEEEDNDSNSIVAETALDRLACGLGGKTILAHITANIPQMLANSDWRFRHAALMAISACGEGCHKQMEIMLSDVFIGVLPFVQDPHPRVRYAACNAIGQMATDFGPLFQKKFHEKVIPAIMLVLDDYANPRVQAHAGAALVNFSEECPKNILTQHLESIVGKLQEVLNAKLKELLEKGTKLVLEQIVTTLAAVADATEEKFILHYDKFMGCLKFIVENATSPELKLLRGKTIECISLIGLAVGRDKFMQDCSDIMELLLKTQTEQADEIADDDPQISYMISAWARMCKIMGKDFQPYLPMVMGPVLKSANIKPEITVLDSDDADKLENDADWSFVNMGDQQSFGIRTAGLEEKATACQMLVCYARELKEGFAEYVEQVVKIMVPLLKFYFHDETRIAAAESLSLLLECAKVKGNEFVQEMWLYIVPKLLEAIEIEPEKDIQAEMMLGLSKCIEKLGKGCLNNQQMSSLVTCFDKLLTEHFQRQQTRQEQRKDEDYDEVVEENLLEEDDEDVFVLSKISDNIHALFGTYKEEFLPVFDRLLTHFVKLLALTRPWADRQWALCIWDDVLEHAGPHSETYQQYFLESMLEAICDKQSEVRQASTYGIGVMAQNAPGQTYDQALREAVPRLVKVIQDYESREEENIPATENAISAITKICKYRPQCINSHEILPHWLSWLPVWEDEDEAIHIYNYLCDLTEENHPAILGQNNSNLPRIVTIIAQAFHKEAISLEDDVATRMINIVKHIQSNPEMLQACVSQLTDDLKQVLGKVLDS